MTDKQTGARAAAEEIADKVFEWGKMALGGTPLPPQEKREEIFTAIIKQHCPQDKAVGLVEALKESIKMIEDITIRFYAPTKAESTEVIIKSTVALSEYERAQG